MMIDALNKWFLLITAICAFSGGSYAAAASPEPVIIGAPLPLTGDLKEFGRIIKNSLELAGEAVNLAGGVNGRPVELRFADDQEKASMAEKTVCGFTKD